MVASLRWCGLASKKKSITVSQRHSGIHRHPIVLRHGSTPQMAHGSQSPRASPIRGASRLSGSAVNHSLFLASVHTSHTTHACALQKLTHGTSSVPGIPRTMSISRSFGRDRHTCPSHGIGPPNPPSKANISFLSRRCSALSTARATLNTRNCDRPSSPKVCQGHTKLGTRCTRPLDRVESITLEADLRS